jgi:hypothetical protein
MKKLKHKEVKQLVLGHSTIVMQNPSGICLQRLPASPKYTPCTKGLKHYEQASINQQIKHLLGNAVGWFNEKDRQALVCDSERNTCAFPASPKWQDTFVNTTRKDPDR